MQPPSRASARPAVNPAPTPLRRGQLAFLSAYFVVVWGAGFVATRVALQYAAPLTYIGVRYTIAALVPLALALQTRADWPATRAGWGHVAVAGLLSHGGYLAGSHYAQYWGLSAGVTALILALQPLVTALVAARWIGERLTGMQIVGSVVGLVGVGLVVAHNVDLGAVGWPGLAAVTWALACVTAGTLYQRQHAGGIDLRAGVVIHFAATAAVLLPLG